MLDAEALAQPTTEDLKRGDDEDKESSADTSFHAEDLHRAERKYAVRGGDVLERYGPSWDLQKATWPKEPGTVEDEKAESATASGHLGCISAGTYVGYTVGDHPSDQFGSAAHQESHSLKDGGRTQSRRECGPG